MDYVITGTYPRSSDKCPATIVMPAKAAELWRWPSGKQITPLGVDFQDWIIYVNRTSPYVEAIPTAKERDAVVDQIWRLIIDKHWGPTQGFQNGSSGKLKLNAVHYLGERVRGTDLGDAILVETIKLDDGPQWTWTHETHPHVLPRIRFQRWWGGSPIDLGGVKDHIIIPVVADRALLPKKILTPIFTTDNPPTSGVIRALLGVRIRSGPGVEYSIMGSMRWHSSVTVNAVKTVSAAETWVQTDYGWMAARYDNQNLIDLS